MALDPKLGKQVTTRTFSLEELVSRAWGSEFRAPDHGIYVFNNGARRFDSTDQYTTGIYGKGVFNLVLDENGNAITDESDGYVSSDP